MIVVDTSAWIELTRSTGSAVDLRLTRAMNEREQIAVTEVVVGEVLAGARREDEVRELESLLLSLPLLRLNGLHGFQRAAALSRACRNGGDTLRHGLLDCLVAAPAIEARASVLHHDRDFDVLARHTPLQVVRLDD